MAFCKFRVMDRCKKNNLPCTFNMEAPLTEELLSMPVITDVDGGRWRPVNEDALQEAIALLKERQG